MGEEEPLEEKEEIFPPGVLDGVVDVGVVVSEDYFI